MKEKKLKAEHGTVVSMPKDFFGYFAWPSVGRLEDGTLVAVASGARAPGRSSTVPELILWS